MMRHFVRALSSLAFLFSISVSVMQATHGMGVDITYECIPGSNCQFRIYHKTYLDCTSGITPPPPPPGQPVTNPYPAPAITFLPSSGCGQPLELTPWIFVSYTEVTPICPSSSTNCQNSSAAIKGTMEASYYRDYDFCAAGPGCTFNVSWSLCDRNSSINSGAADECIYTDITTIKPGQTPCNSSPLFLVPPVPYLCAGEPFTFTQGAFDPDGDSLVYTLTNCMKAAGTPVTYSSGFSAQQPLGPTWDVQIDAQLGDVTITPTPGSQVTVVLCIEVAEYDPITGVLKGKVVRDIQFTALTGCTGANPTVGPIGSSNDSTVAPPLLSFDRITLGGVPITPIAPRKVKTCIGSQLCFEIPVIDTILNINTNPMVGMQYTLSWNGNSTQLPSNFPVGATFCDANNPATLHSITGTRPVAKFCWTPNKYGIFVFQVKVKDQSCPIYRSSSFSIIIQVDDALKNTKVYFHPQACNTEVTLNADAFSSIPSTVPSNVKYFWQGTGNLDTLYNPNCTTDSFRHFYPGPGAYQYTVQIQDTFGCSKTITRIGNVNSGPTAAAGSDISICAGYNFQLGDTMPAGQTYFWSPATYLNNPTLPDPTLSVPANNSTKATVKYTLTVTDTATGCTTYDYVRATVNPNVVATAIPSKPVICVGDNSLLQAGVTNSTGTTTYLWSNNAANATTASVSVSPTATTSYSVIAFENGCASAPANVTVQVTPGPSAQITGQLAVCSGLSTLLTANAPAGTQFLWSGATAGLNPQVATVSNIVAPVTVTLTPTSAIGCAGPPVSVQVNPYPKPTNSFSVNLPCAGSPSAFTDLSTVAGGGGVVAWAWVFGDGATSAEQAPQHTYAQPGNYPVSLSVTTENGCTNTVLAVQQATVKAVPVANFDFTNVCEGSPTVFSNTSNLPNPKLPTDFMTYSWAFGNSGVSASAQQNPTVTYPTFGEFNAVLTATSNNGCSATKEKTIFVYPNPIANFSYVGACEDSAVTFSPTPSVVPGNNDFLTNFQWQFTPTICTPDASTAFGPGVAYSQFGTYSATLLVTTNHGCVDNVTLPVLVYAAPVADFRWERPCENENTRFISNSSAAEMTPITKWSWDVLDDSIWQVSPNTISHNYMAAGGAGTYTVKLAIETNVGCLDTVEKVVIINPAPRVDFTLTDTCQQDTALFTDKTVVIIQGNTSNTQLEDWYWDFGDGTASRLPSPTHYYLAPNRYTVTLKVVTDSTCFSQFSQNVNIFPHPTDPVVYNDTTCFGKITSLTATSDGTVNWFKNEMDGTPFFTGTTFYTDPIVARERYYVGAFNQYGCTSKRVPIAAYPFTNLDAVLQLSDSVFDLPLASAAFEVVSSRPISSYTWDFGDGMTSSGLIAAVFHEYEQSGFYPITVNVTDNEGCRIVLEDLIEVRKVVNVSVPTAFSPNGDQFNDFFSVKLYNIQAMRFQVFDRWGKTVFVTTDKEFQWDGSDTNGKTLREDVYPFIIETVDFEGKVQAQKGSVTILR